jgi:GntR family transcriptional regulator
VVASTLIHIDPDDPRPLYVQIVDEVRRGILRGDLSPDAPLPSVRELARDLRVNPNTVQQAYRELEREGEILVRRGQGSFVAPNARNRDLRERVVREVAEHCLREGVRAGLTAGELARAILEAGGYGPASLSKHEPKPEDES